MEVARMRFRHRAWMIVASACLAVSAGPAVAEGTGDPEKSKIVRQLPVPDDLRDFLERLGQPAQVRDLMEQLNKNPENHRAPATGGRSSDRKSTRLNSSHVSISYAVFC